MQLAYAYEARNRFATPDPKAYQVLRSAVLPAAAQRDEALVRERARRAAKLIPRVTQLVDPSPAQAPTERRRTRESIQHLLIESLGIREARASSLAKWAMNRDLRKRMKGPAGAATAVLAAAVGCRYRYLEKLEDRPYAPFQEDPGLGLDQGDFADQRNPRLFDEFDPTPFHYIFELVGWPSTDDDRFRLANMLAAARLTSPHGITPAMTKEPMFPIPWNSPLRLEQLQRVKQGKELPSHKARAKATKARLRKSEETAPMKATAKRRHEKLTGSDKNAATRPPPKDRAQARTVKRRA